MMDAETVKAIVQWIVAPAAIAAMSIAFLWFLSRD